MQKMPYCLPRQTKEVVINESNSWAVEYSKIAGIERFSRCMGTTHQPSMTMCGMLSP